MGIIGTSGNHSNLREPVSKVVVGAQFYNIFVDFQELSDIAGSFKHSRKANIS